MEGDTTSLSPTTMGTVRPPQRPSAWTQVVTSQGRTVTAWRNNEHNKQLNVPLLLVPCGPEDVRASVACVTGELTVTWNISVPADNYTTIISRGMGEPLHCNSSQTQCTTGGLACGSSYVVVVFSVTGTCFSLPSPEVTVQTCEKRGIITNGEGALGFLRSQTPVFFISLQCRALPPTSQRCTRVRHILFL